MTAIEKIKKWLERKNGVLTTRSAFVKRDSYFGNDIIAPNSSLEHADERGYVPVELWIMSATPDNDHLRIQGEGKTVIAIDDEKVTLTELRDTAEELLFGDYASLWPLAKILDIGGKPVKTSFGTTETPPIPVHVQGGLIKNGKVQKPGKTEAYFFPPLDISPYNKNIEAITRIGLKSTVTKDEFKKKMESFGKDDSMYTLLNEFPIKPMTGWTVPAGVIHAPGPYLTFEIQLPIDDGNFASWKLGERLEGDERTKQFNEKVLNGLKDEDEFIEELLDWPATTDPEPEKSYFRTPKTIEDGPWGKRYQIFFDMFYGEGWEILPGKELIVDPKKVPQAGIVWSGQGTINDNKIELGGNNEFFVVPNMSLTIKNTGETPLFIYTVEPIRRS